MDISVVIPLLNEADSLRELYERIDGALGPLGRKWEVIFINDGSTDSSMDVLRALHEQYENVTVLVFRRNLGKSAALSVGFKEAAGDVVFTMDADLQDDPAELPVMLEVIESGYDLVSGWKKDRKDPLSKRLPSKLYNAVTSKLSGVGIHDMNCGLKAYRGQVIKTIKVYGELHRYTPVLAQWAGFTVTEVPVKHHARQYGRSKFGAERFLRGFFDLLTVLFLQRYVTRPLHLFGMLGGLLFSGGFLAGLYLTVLKFMGQAIGRRPLLTLAILLMVVGVQLISLGLIGEMVVNLKGSDISYPVRERLGRKDGGLVDSS